jgi:hypothetical protein
MSAVSSVFLSVSFLALQERAISLWLKMCPSNPRLARNQYFTEFTKPMKENVSVHFSNLVFAFLESTLECVCRNSTFGLSAE